ncbi:MAG: DMT family transporter [Lachnospiraceae bacterium]
MDQTKFMQKTIIVWLGAMICCALWGSAYPCIKIGYQMFAISDADTSSQILFAGIRFTMAGLLAILFGSIGSRKFLKPHKKAWEKIFILSMLQTVGQYIFFYIGLAHTTGVKASILDGTNVFIAILVASLLMHQEKLNLKKVSGCVIGFAGMVLVNLNGSGMDFHMTFLGEGFIIISAVVYAFSSVMVKEFSKKENPVMLSGYQFVMGGFILVIIGLLFGGRLTVISAKGILLLVYMAFISAVAYSLWGLLLKYNPVSKVAVFGFMNPIFGAVLSALFLGEGEAVSWVSMLSLLLVCVGIYIVNHEKEAAK